MSNPKCVCGTTLVERFDYVRINDLAEQAIPNGKYECLVCKKKLAALQASHEELVKALETARPYVPNRTIGDRLLHRSFDDALTNAAKLAPTKSAKKEGV